MKTIEEYFKEQEQPEPEPPIPDEENPDEIDPGFSRPVTPPDEEIICPCLSIDEMLQTYLFGIDLTDPQGNPFPRSLMAGYLNSSIAYAESLFDICLTEQEFTENHDYERQDYQNWGYLQLWHRPVKQVKSLCMMMGNRPSYQIPNDWVRLDQNGGKIQLYPSSGSAGGLLMGSSGGMYGAFHPWSYVPQVWRVEYTAGMTCEEFPQHLKELIYKYAAMGILQVWGDLILGAGIASSSLSIDGLSQSIGTTQSAMYGGASARCEEYRKDIQNLIPVIRQKYDGIKMVVL